MIADCPPEVLKSFVEQYTEVEVVQEKQWNDIFMRWRLINFLIDNKVLEVQDGKLVETESASPAVIQQTEGFLKDAEVARATIEANPRITSKELAESMGWKSHLYALSVLVFARTVYDIPRDAEVTGEEEEGQTQ